MVTAEDPAPRCRRCGDKLNLTPVGVGQPSLDAANLAAGAPYCQACIVEVLRNFQRDR